jgi:hypothetical protein
MDGIAAIIRAGAKNLIRLDAARVDIAKGFWSDLDLSLDAFLEAKRFRDAVIHANIYDEPRGIAWQYASQNTVYEVILTVDVLRWLAGTCLILASELREWKKVLEAESKLMENYAADDQVKSPLVQAVLDGVAQAQSYRPHRQSLGPAPKFPQRLTNPPV